ncbi:hypothetical protein CCR75_005533 [Bremia lactucae]|uniref:Uncharacterized protein n=1 Tax=Bremia lactucae TaxID=4779 RepID=A0A976FQ16_BRELC|nr:hypothetical protein CCR75_005533 [Bremia lactucae]
MTFNLRFAGNGDGLNDWEHRKGFVAGLIDQHPPVLLGETSSILSSLLKIPYERFGFERERNGEHVQIFYDPFVLKRFDHGTFWLSERPDTFGNKGGTALVSIIAGDAPVFLVGDFTRIGTLKRIDT